MFDKVTFYLLQNPFPDFGIMPEFIIGPVVLSKSITPSTNQIFYEGWYKNMRFALYESRLYISNSISSFVYGHNANDITFNQLKDSITEISKTVNCEPCDLLIKDIEFGFTIISELKATRILKRLIIHKQQEGKQENRQGHLTSVKFYHINYNLKIYDKGKVEKLRRKINMQGDWLRIEQQFKKKHIPKSVVSAADLLDKENVKIIFVEFVKQWNSIIKAPFINHNKYSKVELQRIYTLLSPTYYEDRSDYVSKEAIKKEQQRFKKELLTIGDYSPFERIQKHFTDKFNSLMTSEYVPDFPAILLAENRGHY